MRVVRRAPAGSRCGWRSAAAARGARVRGAHPSRALAFRQSQPWLDAAIVSADAAAARGRGGVAGLVHARARRARGRAVDRAARARSARSAPDRGGAQDHVGAGRRVRAVVDRRRAARAWPRASATARAVARAGAGARPVRAVERRAHCRCCAGLVLLGGAPFHFWPGDLFHGARAHVAPFVASRRCSSRVRRGCCGTWTASPRFGEAAQLVRSLLTLAADRGTRGRRGHDWLPVPTRAPRRRAREPAGRAGAGFARGRAPRADRSPSTAGLGAWAGHLLLASTGATLSCRASCPQSAEADGARVGAVPPSSRGPVRRRSVRAALARRRTGHARHVRCGSTWRASLADLQPPGLLFGAHARVARRVRRARQTRSARAFGSARTSPAPARQVPDRCAWRYGPRAARCWYCCGCGSRDADSRFPCAGAVLTWVGRKAAASARRSPHGTIAPHPSPACSRWPLPHSPRRCPPRRCSSPAAPRAGLHAAPSDGVSRATARTTVEIDRHPCILGST